MLDRRLSNCINVVPHSHSAGKEVAAAGGHAWPRHWSSPLGSYSVGINTLSNSHIAMVLQGELTTNRVSMVDDYSLGADEQQCCIVYYCRCYVTPRNALQGVDICCALQRACKCHKLSRQKQDQSRGCNACQHMMKALRAHTIPRDVRSPAHLS